MKNTKITPEQINKAENTVASEQINESKNTATPEQINKWKAEHGDIFVVECEDKLCYLKKPTRGVLSAASTIGATDPFGYNEIVIKNCWLGGDLEMQTNDAHFMAVSSQLGALMEIKKASIKKL